jgi:hypothetical protein
MAGRALRLPEEQRLPTELRRGGLLGVELAEDVELRRRREVQDLLELAHEVDLASALQDVDALLTGDHVVPVEIGTALLELREVLDRLQCPLRAEEPLDIDPAQRRRLDPMAELLGADVADQVGRAVGVAVLVTIEAGDAEARLLAAAIGGDVELLLGKWSQQEPQALVVTSWPRDTSPRSGRVVR